MNKKILSSLTRKQMKKINGGGLIIAVAAISIAYSCWAASFIYTMGKDGKSGINK